MKKLTLPILAIISALQFISCNNSSKTEGDEGSSGNAENASSDDASQRYQLKSAIVTSKTTNSMMGGDITTMLYFDDHGKKEMTKTTSKISMMGQNIETISNSLLKDGWYYNWEEGKNTGSKFQLTEMMDPSKMDYEKMSEDMMKQLGVKKVGSETIMGKKCDKYEMNKEGMGTGNFWLWKNIAMKSEMVIGGMKMNIEVTNIDENPNFTKDQFDVPSNITFTEMTVPAANN